LTSTPLLDISIHNRIVTGTGGNGAPVISAGNWARTYVFSRTTTTGAYLQTDTPVGVVYSFLFWLQLNSLSETLKTIVSTTGLQIYYNVGKLSVTQNSYTLTSTATEALGAWAHHVITFDGTTMIMYKNGAQVASGAVTGTPWTGSSSNPMLLIGENLNGFIDDISVHEYVLPLSQVFALYEYSLQSATTYTPLIAYSSINATHYTFPLWNPALGSYVSTVSTFVVNHSANFKQINNNNHYIDNTLSYIARCNSACEPFIDDVELFIATSANTLPSPAHAFRNLALGTYVSPQLTRSVSTITTRTITSPNATIYMNAVTPTSNSQIRNQHMCKTYSPAITRFTNNCVAEIGGTACGAVVNSAENVLCPITSFTRRYAYYADALPMAVVPP
jgi:hypothetical protein